MVEEAKRSKLQALDLTRLNVKLLDAGRRRRVAGGGARCGDFGSESSYASTASAHSCRHFAATPLTGIKTMKHLRKLDLSENPALGGCVGEMVALLPAGLQELHITACGISELPQSFKRLTDLRKLFAGANSCVGMNWRFHVCLSFTP
jgi:Leucine-rich repeat (LRR) protein